MTKTKVFARSYALMANEPTLRDKAQGVATLLKGALGKDGWYVHSNPADSMSRYGVRIMTDEGGKMVGGITFMVYGDNTAVVTITWRQEFPQFLEAVESVARAHNWVQTCPEAKES